MNEVVLIGKIVSDVTLSSTAKGTQLANMDVEVERNFRNEDGTITMDLFRVTLWKGVAETCAAVAKPGMQVAIKGRLQGTTFDKNEKTFYNTQIVAEKVEFLSELK